MNNVLITGGAGFIGSHVVREFLSHGCKVYNLDKLTYAGNLMNLTDIEENENYTFIKGDINDSVLVEQTMRNHSIDTIVHLAAESHVDRSITNPMEFVTTNVCGTVTLLNSAIRVWGDDMKDKLFYHVSTDEVYGSLSLSDDSFKESNKYVPHSPYSASKASSDHFVRAYHDTYGLPIVISNCSNNYGPNQFPEKLIPLVINNILNGKKIPIYGNGSNIRDWLFVKDHAKAIYTIASTKSVHNGTFNIGGNYELTNISMVHSLIHTVALLISEGDNEKYMNLCKEYSNLITYVEDRKGHDARYSIDTTKYEHTFNAKLPYTSFDDGIAETVKWYLENGEWLEKATSGEYQDYYKERYEIN